MNKIMKKGSGKYILMVVLIALAIIAGFPFVSFGKTLLSFFTPQVDAEAKENFAAFELAVKTLLDGETPVMSIRTPLKIPSDYAIACFDSTQFLWIDKMINGKSVLKPLECGYNACICLFKNPTWQGITQMEEEKIACIAYDKGAYFYTKMDIGAGKGIKTSGYLGSATDYFYPVFYGKRTYNMNEFGTKDLWIEGQKLDGKYYIYIAEYGEAKDDSRILDNAQ